jgi:transposase
VFDKFHVMHHANAAIDEVRRAEFFRKGRRRRGLVRQALAAAEPVGESGQQEEAVVERAVWSEPEMMKAYLLKESLDRLWRYRYEGAALRYLNGWIDQLRWQRLAPFQKLRKCRSAMWKAC